MALYVGTLMKKQAQNLQFLKFPNVFTIFVNKSSAYNFSTIIFFTASLFTPTSSYLNQRHILG